MNTPVIEDDFASSNMSARDVTYSVVIPVFNEQEVLPLTYVRVKAVLDTLGEPYELVFVNDGSRDASGEQLDALAARDDAVRVIHFSRNFGHQVAISAGMAYASGKAVIVMDADLQDPPEVIPDLVRQWQAGYAVVYARRIQREGETWFKRWTAAAFYRILHRMANVEIPLDAGDFRLLDQSVCRVLTSLPEKHRFVRGLVAWTGFKQTAVEYVRAPREAGETKYPLRRMIRLATDAITSFSDKPLRWALTVGLLLLLLCGGGWVYALLAAVAWHGASGRLLWGLANLTGDALILTAIGCIGLYVGRLYEQALQRPLYIVERTRGFHRGSNS
ncbi:glycosyl transferase [Alicyclobacillus contaminans]|uniref:glycosyltransferase family 2 protein n=1 Tax=Alicyclobacillus contaminans TaxID=392016 RepID=UPI00040CC4E0|nr:glycosyltransferase family 2 protein [Alicyclobacillus contaminans]GMA51197.1 glycosyl transferase [Alicyclobacillus contaminans]